MLRNGRRDRATFEASQVSTTWGNFGIRLCIPLSHTYAPPYQPPSQVPLYNSVSREIFAISAVMRKLNLLKSEVRVTYLLSVVLTQPAESPYGLAMYYIVIRYLS